MGLLDGTTQQQYYQGNDFGNYQFTSLEDIINQFMVVYVGDQKIISKASRIDVAFHAQRALAELSFDTFKSIKAQEIVVPATLQMILPRDYVNYTKLSWSDSAGIKHLLYPTSKTSNPIQIQQDDDGHYKFPAADPVLVNSDFSDVFQPPWFKSDVGLTAGGGAMLGTDTIAITSGELTFTQHVHFSWTKDLSRIYTVWQEIDVSQLSTIDLSSKGTTAAATVNVTGGTLKIGLTASAPDTSTTYYPNSTALSLNVNPIWLQTLGGNPAYLEWLVGQSGVTQSLVDAEAIDVSAHNTVYVLITSVVDFTTTSTTDSGVNSIDDILLTNIEDASLLKTNTTSSTTWNNYKSGTPSENQDDYQDDTYWPMNGSRFGLDPQHAQANGSFFIDQRLGKIHFSSNISGKTVVLDYISDSLGTDGEMQVHKFAEEAMYRWILHGVAAGRIQTQQIVPRLKKEKFAAIRQAKLRLSDIKIEELTQILRGKSKQIKH